MPDLASQEWPLKQCFNPGTLVAHWKARFTSLPVTVRCWQFHILHKYPPVTALWANSTTVRRPVDKMKPKDWFRQFFLFFFIIFYFFFGLKLRGTRHLATRLQNTLQWPHFGPTVQPLGDPWTKWNCVLVVVVVVAFIYSRLLNRHKKSTSRVPTGEGKGEACGGRGERTKYKHFKLQYGESLLTLTQRIAKG